MKCVPIVVALAVVCLLMKSSCGPVVFAQTELQTAGRQSQDDVASQPLTNVFDEQYELWPVDLTIRGTIRLLSYPDRSLAEQVAGIAPVIERAIEMDADSKFVILAFGQIDPATLDVPQTIRDQVVVAGDDAEATLESMVERLSDLTHVAICTGNGPLDESVSDSLSKMKQSLADFVHNGGTLIASNDVIPGIHGLIPDSIVMTDFDVETDLEKLLEQLSADPRKVGIGIAPGTTLQLDGRKFRIAEGEATFVLAANERNPHRIKTLKRQSRSNRSPYNTVVDLTAWRRMAIERTVEPFPESEPRTPYVANGSLIIVGGGGMPEGSNELFIELAGGKDARLIYVPCEESERIRRQPGILRRWRRAGVASAEMIHTKDRNQANNDEAFLEPLKDATGIFFGGGRQWNLADSYYGTEAHRLMKQVLDRGGVIAGSSAGASIQGRYLARANPVANFDVMAPGYERGLGFLSGVAIDQHFSQRGRQKDVRNLVLRYPQLLGIGIDESTAIVVQESNAKVIGDGKVWFYNQDAADENPCEPMALGDGSVFNLAMRKIISQPSDNSLTTPDTDSAETGESADK